MSDEKIVINYLNRFFGDSCSSVQPKMSTNQTSEIIRCSPKIVLVEQQIAKLESPKLYKDFCRICLTELKSIMHAKTHYKSVRHLVQVNVLKQQLLRIPPVTGQIILRQLQSCKLESLAFLSENVNSYCDVCSVDVVVSSLVDNHYNSEEHTRNLECYYSTCDVNAKSEETLVEHRLLSQDLRLPSHRQEDNCLSTPQGERTLSSKKPTMSDLKSKQSYSDLFKIGESNNSSQNSSDPSVKRQIYVELQKLIDTLYYSKSLPDIVSLDYLRKTNNEITELKRKYQKKLENSGTFPERTTTGTISKNFTEVESENGSGHNRKSSSIQTVSTPPLSDIELRVSENLSFQNIVETPDVMHETAQKNYSLKNVDKHIHPKEEILQITIEDKPDQSFTENGDLLKSDEKGNNLSEELENSENFKGMLEKIRSSRNVISPPAWNLRNEELLDEIEILIELVDSGDIPSNIMLSYLRECNKQLEGFFNGNTELKIMPN